MAQRLLKAVVLRRVQISGRNFGTMFGMEMNVVLCTKGKQLRFRQWEIDSCNGKRT